MKDVSAKRQKMLPKKSPLVLSFMGCYMLARISKELKNLMQELLYLNGFLLWSDRLALLGSLCMLLGVFLPWISANGLLTQTGLMGGGDTHLIIALVTIMRVKKAAKSHIHAVKKNELHLLSCRLRRVSLHYMLFGIASLITSCTILIYWGTQHATTQNQLDIRLGFYLSLVSGLLIFLAGLERFSSH